MKSACELISPTLFSISMVLFGASFLWSSNAVAFTTLPAAQRVSATEGFQVTQRNDRRWRNDRYWRGPGWRGPGWDNRRAAFYWSGWAPYSRYCRKRCKIDRWSGRVIHCTVRCR